MGDTVNISYLKNSIEAEAEWLASCVHASGKIQVVVGRELPESLYRIYSP